MTSTCSSRGVTGLRGRRRLLVTAALSAALVLTMPEAAFASVSASPDATAQVNGTVYAVAQVGTRTIIGGQFTSVGGVARRNAAAIRADGTVDPTFNPRPDDIVYAVAGTADGSRIFLGGIFDNVGSTPRANLAAVDPTTGAAISTWNPGTNGDVLALAISGTRLYVGGRFTAIGPLARRRLAAVDVTTANVSVAFNPWPDWTVRGVAVSPDGTKVYAVGGFKIIGGVSRPGAAEVLSTNGQATAFNPSAGGVVLAVALTPNGSRLYYSTTNNRLYAYDPAAANTPVYVVQTSGDTQAIAASASEVYFGGHFSRLSTYRVRRAHLASIRVSDGGPTTWNPGVDGSLGVWAVAVTPSSVVIGGDFFTVNGQARRGFARFTGTP